MAAVEQVVDRWGYKRRVAVIREEKRLEEKRGGYKKREAVIRREKRLYEK